MIRLLSATLAATALTVPAWAGETTKVLTRADQRFASKDIEETPSFQRHVLPLMGRLGCNGRACHGSFQGQGGFRLSLFGYDFKADLDALLAGDNPRVDKEAAADSLMLQKPTLAVPHKGGKRLEEDTWQYRVFEKWIEAGAKGVEESDAHFVKLEVIPREIVFTKPGETTQLKVLAHWSDGTIEDVTPLCRYRTNDESIAEIDENGLVKSLGPGDSAVVAFYDNGVVPTQVMLPVSDKVGPKYPEVPAPTKIDQLVVEKLRKLGVVPSELADDTEFLRRVSIDITGTLPTPEEIETFVKDQSPDKRAKKIDELLERPAYAAWTTTLLCDLTGNNARQLQRLQPLQAQAAEQWYAWIHKRVKENMPYDKLIAGIVLAKSRQPEQSYDEFLTDMVSYVSKKETNGDKAFAEREYLPYYWARQQLVGKSDEMALAFSHTFLGVRLQCAQCHKHPFDQWTQNDFKQFAAFFDRVRFGTAPDAQKRFNELQEELGLRKLQNNNERQRKINETLAKGEPVPIQEVFVQPTANSNRDRGKEKGRNRQQPQRTLTPKLLGGDEVVEQYSDPREAVMEWMLDKDNPYFARAFVNRVWARYFGVGIIEPADDMNLANPPSNPALLDYLTDAFIESGYDMKSLQREICNSRTYQLTWRPNETNKFDTRNFSRASVRRLPAEVAYDAIVQATATSAEMAALVEDPSKRAIADPRSNPNRGGRGNSNYALRVFGQPDRATACDCERSTEPSLTQSLYLMNDTDLFALMDRKDGRFAELARAMAKSDEAKKAPAEKETESDEAKPNKGETRGKDRDVNRQKLAARAKEMQQRIKQLREKGNEDEANALQKKLVAVREQLRQAERAVKETEEKNEEATTEVADARDTEQALDEDALIREMYLRTLSRYPDNAELSRSREYLAAAKDPVTGVRDVFWALLNTKEFIVNH